MALKVFMGSLQTPTTTGNVSYTGPDFTPKLILFFLNTANGNETAAEARTMIGAAVSTTSRVVSGYASGNNLATTNCAVFDDNTSCIYLADATPTALKVADLVSMDTGGFTLSWSTADASTFTVDYIALGGADLTNVATGTLAEKTTTGSQAYTGVGFAPTALFVWQAKRTSSTTFPSSFNGTSRLRVGFSDGTNDGYTCIRSQDNAAAANTARSQDTSNIIGCIALTTNVIDDLASLTSFDADGFTFNWSVVNGTANTHFYVALRGPQFKVGSISQPTSPASVSTTGVGFRPKMLYFQSFQSTATASVIDDAQLSQGGAQTSSTYFTKLFNDEDAADPTNTDSARDNTYAVKIYDDAASSTVASAKLVTMSPNGFSLNWDVADATAREILYFAAGDFSGPPSRLMLGVGS